MGRTRKSWKEYERVVMIALGGVRIPVTGRAGPGGDPGDGELPGHYVEIRDRKDAQPIRWFKEVAGEARARKVIPVLVFKGPSTRLSPLVLLRLRDLQAVIAHGRSARNPGRDPGRQGGAADAGALAGGGKGPYARRRPAASVPGPGDPGPGDRAEG
jgi:hypothetical protein